MVASKRLNRIFSSFSEDSAALDCPRPGAGGELQEPPQEAASHPHLGLRRIHGWTFRDHGHHGARYRLHRRGLSFVTSALINSRLKLATYSEKVTNGNETTRPPTDSISNYGSSHAIQQTRPATRPQPQQPRQQGGSNGVRWGQRSSSSNASGGVETMEAAAMVHPVGTRYE